MENYSEEQIQKMVKAYENKRTREKKYYETVKDTEEFKIANRTRANNWYMKNQKARQESYNKNKEINGAKSSYYYYKKLDRVEEFKTKYPEKYKLLVDNHYLSEQNPDASVETSNSSSEAEPSI